MSPITDGKAGEPGVAEVQMRVLPLGARHFVPRVGQGVRLLGVVRRGLETGALAWMPDGRYAQVNGDIVQPLDAQQVEAALQCAGIAFPRVQQAAQHPAPTPGGQAPRAPTVVVKRRRLVQLPGDGRGGRG